MASSALFAAPVKASDVSHLYQFRAGKLTQNGNLLTADPRKGWAYFYVSQKSTLHFCWFDRATSIVEDNLVVQPENSSFKKVSQCKDARVYRLKTGDKRFFIWMQEPDKNDDNRICDNVKGHLANNSKHGNAMGVIGDLNGLSANTPVRTATGKGPASGKSKGKIQLDDLRNIMSTIGGTSASASQSSIDLNNVINADTLKESLNNAVVKESLLKHLPVLPTNDALFDLVRDNFADPVTHIRSAQFRSAVNAFSNAMQKGGLGTLVSQFHMGSKVTEAANKGDILEFAKALEEQMASSKPEESDRNMDTS